MNMSTETPKQTQNPETAETQDQELPKNIKNAVQKLEEKRDEALEKIDEIYEQKYKELKIRPKSIAEGELNRLVDNQRKKIREFYGEKISKLIALRGDIDAQFNEMNAELEKNNASVLQTLKLSLAANIHGEDLTPESVYGVKRTMEAIDEMKKSNPKLFEIYETLIDKGKLTPDNYKTIISTLNSSDIESTFTDPKKSFEATATGAIIARMDKEQRKELIKNLIESDKKADTGQIIESFLMGGLLEKEEVKDLWNNAKQKGLITPEQDLKFNQTDYSQKAQEFQQQVREQIQKTYGGRYHRNAMDAFVGMPLLKTIGALWGTTVLALNIANNRNDLASLIKNPWAIAGAGALGTSLYFGGGKFIGDTLFGGSEEEKEDSPETKNAKATLEQIYTKGNLQFKNYLENGGFNTLIKFREQLKDKETIDSLTIEELMKLETTQEQKDRLKLLQTENNTSAGAINTQFIQVLKSAKTARITTDAQMRELIKNTNN